MDTEQQAELLHALRVDKKLAESLRDLIRFEPFQRYQEYLNRRIDDLAQIIFEPLDDHPNASGRQEYNKGTLKGFILTRDLPSVIVQAMAQEAPGETPDVDEATD